MSAKLGPRVSFRCPDALLDEIQAISDAEDRTQAQLIRLALREFVDRRRNVATKGATLRQKATKGDGRRNVAPSGDQKAPSGDAPRARDSLPGSKTLEVQDLTPPTPPEGGTTKRAHQMPADWQPSDGNRVLAAELGVDLDAEVAKFRDFHRSKGSKFLRWDLACNTWLRNAASWQPRNGHARASPGLVAIGNSRDPSAYDDYTF